MHSAATNLLTRNAARRHDPLWQPIGQLRQHPGFRAVGWSRQLSRSGTAGMSSVRDDGDVHAQIDLPRVVASAYLKHFKNS
jgi:hypothetical protein